MIRIALLTAALFLLAACDSPDSARGPNIVFILADDLGVDAIGAYGGTSYNTPNIDELAKTGMRFTQTYSAPVCSPSRVKLMTGRYGFRTGQAWGYIPPDEITFGHALQDTDYEVVLSGKWQMALLKDDPEHIRKMGFDDSIVFGWHEGPRYYEPLIYENGKVRDDVTDAYGPDIFNDYIINFIKNNKDRQFFAYYPMVLAHDISNDLESPPPTGPRERYETFKENVEYSDALIGRVIATLDELNLRKNTLVIYLSDNGTPHKYITDYRDGEYIKEPVFSAVGDTVLQGGKSFLTDQGTHVPFIANWQVTIESGSISDALVDFSDFFPTIAELTGAKLPEGRILDGDSLVPTFMDATHASRSWVFQEWEGRAWIRNADWKLYLDGSLYAMKDDPFEETPIVDDSESPLATNAREFLSAELRRLQPES